jgi:NAD(P)-dependent dehydrogenase (short-subunit alcohol dehydrogenase family)
MRMKLSNKIVLITGGTSGIGLEAAKRWCMELWLLKTAFGLPEMATQMQSRQSNRGNCK